MRPATFAAAILVGLTGQLSSASGWSDEGHRVIGEIASHYLSPQADTRVGECLTDVAYPTLADAATWADSYARGVSSYDFAKPLHYVNVDPKADVYRAERDCPSGCVVGAISRFLSVLRESGDDLPTRERRKEALYFVAHFVGDIHQPLHVAHPDNRGGNFTQVSFFGEARRAHWVWDEGLFQKRHVSLGRAGTHASADWKALAFALRMRLEPKQVAAMQAHPSPERWANESLALARQHAFLRDGQVVEDAYVRAKWQVVERQLQRAGVRLAAVLNATFDVGGRSKVQIAGAASRAAK
jgi:hypothetical protein